MFKRNGFSKWATITSSLQTCGSAFIAGGLIAVTAMTCLADADPPRPQKCWAVPQESCLDRYWGCLNHKVNQPCFYCDGTGTLTAICVDFTSGTCTGFSWANCGPRRTGACSNEFQCFGGVLDGQTCLFLRCNNPT